MKKRILFILCCLFSANLFFGQKPHMEGKITVSIKSGTIDADLKLSNLPDIKNYSIILNKGLNIEYFRDSVDSYTYHYQTESEDDLMSDVQYYIPAKGKKSRFLPTSFIVKYTGKFPVYADTSKMRDFGDWKTTIAFNGSTLRAAESTMWYPTLYDKTNDRYIDKYSYDVVVECTDCQTLYLNGDVPKKTQKANFKSELPVPMLMYLGNYDFIQHDDIYILNSDVNGKKLKSLSDATKRIINFYEKKLKIPYGKSIVFAEATPITKSNAWMFVTYPSIFMLGRGTNKLDNMFDTSTSRLNESSFNFITHELGHYYIGNKFVPNSKLFWFFLEGVTDYISLKAINELAGGETFQSTVNMYIENLNNFNPTPLNKIKKEKEIGNIYRYRYSPLLLLAIEQEIGEDKMYEWLSFIINSKNQTTDYDFFVNSFKSVGVKDKEIVRLEKTYITSENSKENVIKKIK